MAEDNKCPPAGIYEHYNSTEGRPKLYEVFDIAVHSETNEVLVLYKPQYDCLDLEDTVGLRPYFVRPLDMFIEDVEHDGRLIPRFKLVKKTV